MEVCLVEKIRYGYDQTEEGEEQSSPDVFSGSYIFQKSWQFGRSQSTDW